jgi:hypothetical protein
LEQLALRKIAFVGAVFKSHPCARIGHGNQSDQLKNEGVKGWCGNPALPPDRRYLDFRKAGSETELFDAEFLGT